MNLLLAAKQLIAKAWKKPSASFQEVKEHITMMMIIDKMFSILNDSQPKFLKIWELWLQYALPSVHITSMSYFWIVRLFYSGSIGSFPFPPARAYGLPLPPLFLFSFLFSSFFHFFLHLSKQTLSQDSLPWPIPNDVQQSWQSECQETGLFNFAHGFL